MGQFLENHKLLNSNQNKIDKLKSSIAIQDIGFVIKMLPPKKKSSGPDGFTGEFTIQRRVNNVNPTCTLPENRRDHFLILFEAIITLTPKPIKDNMQK